MADETLKGLKIAVFVTDGFEEVELTEPHKVLDQAGADTRVVSPNANEVQSWSFTDWGERFPVDLSSKKPDRKISTHCYCPAV